MIPVTVARLLAGAGRIDTHREGISVVGAAMMAQSLPISPRERTGIWSAGIIFVLTSAACS
jgi:hypothetical protein